MHTFFDGALQGLFLVLICSGLVLVGACLGGAVVHISRGGQ